MILASPLIFSADIIQGTKLNGTLLPEMKDILVNAEMIAVDQDPMGKAGRRVRCSGPGGCESYFKAEANRTEVWMYELADGGLPVALLNRDWPKDGLTTLASAGRLGINGSTSCRVRDLWGRKNLGVMKSEVRMSVGPHDTAVVKVTGCR